MLNIQRLMQICLLATALNSSALLAISTNSVGLFLIALICAVGGFALTDLLKCFRIEGWLANVVSIAILILAMKDFFFIDSSGKLIAVSNLLVYLQSVLMFQNKTPRLNWQILVLSLLQVVITTIFSVGFSNSYLLLLYFAVAGAAMVLQSIYTETIDIAKRNKSVIPIMKAVSSGSDTVRSSAISIDRRTLTTPLTLFDDVGYRKKTLLHVAVRLSYWMVASLLFTSVLFLMAPRTNKPLFQPITYKVAATGLNNEVNLNESGLIRGSNTPIFTAQIIDTRSNTPMRVGNVPYYRSMALSTLTIEDGQTNWRAPFDRIDDSFYRALPSGRFRTADREVKQIITLEQTTNPMVYGIMPIRSTPNSPGNIEFCSEISAHVRARADGKVTLSPFKYEIGTLLDKRGFSLPGWPHYSFDPHNRQGFISTDSMPHQWLTEIDRQRYPVLVAEADRLAAENAAANGTFQNLVDKFTDYFSGNRFKYTLDYRLVPRDKSIDSVEDFFANHRSGHCEMYASALTLMLRSQNIPARLVVGFMAKEFNELTNSYTIRGKHAHAWVEVYLHPDACSDEMFARGVAGPAGAWITADPNPIATLAGGGDATSNPIELARTVWQDIVLGMEGRESRDGQVNTFFLFRHFQNLLTGGTNAIKTVRSWSSHTGPQVGLLALLAIFLFARIYIRSSKIKSVRKSKNLEKVGIFRRLMASAVGLISTDLEQWMLRIDDRNTLFYDEFASILKSKNLQRDDHQTQREFAELSMLHFNQHPDHQRIANIIRHTTERFYEVRFGQRELTQLESEKIARDLESLKSALNPRQLQSR